MKTHRQLSIIYTCTYLIIAILILSTLNIEWWLSAIVLFGGSILMDVVAYDAYLRQRGKNK